MGRDRHFASLREAETAALGILAGSQRGDARALLELIHVINPTGRFLASYERSRRYALKSRLQSYLVRSFRDELRVVLDPSAPGAVSLQHRTLGVDACHAMLSELDDDARAWVQLQLDLGTDADDERAPPARPRKTRRAEREPRPAQADGEALAHARAAIEAYDYERARTLYADALNGPEGAAAAIALLELLVENLGDVHAALAVEPRLSAHTLEREEVRALLALAAARAGDASALKRSRGLGAERRAAVYVALIEAAVSDRREEDARVLLAEMRAADLTHASLPSIRLEVERLGESARAPLERELGELLASGREHEAESLARRILQAWPMSTAARAGLKSIHKARRDRTVLALRAEAERALGARDVGAAHQAVESLRAMDEPCAELEETVDRLEREQAEIETERRIAWTLTLAASGASLERWMTEYAALDDVSRSRVRGACAERALDLYEQIRNKTRGTKPPVRIAAVLAVVSAERLIDAGEVERAAGELVLHERMLSGVPIATALRRRVEKARERARRVDAAERLARAEQSYEAGDAASALRRLSSVGLELLSTDERARADSLRLRAARQIEINGAREAMSLAESREDWDQVVEHAARLTSADPARADEYVALRTRALEKLQAETVVVHVRGAVETGALGVALGTGLLSSVLVSTEGDEVYVAGGRGRIAGVFVLDRQTSVIKEALAVDWRGGFSAGAFIDARTLTVVPAGGDVVTLERPSWQVVRRRPLVDVGGADSLMVHVQPSAENGVWLTRTANIKADLVRSALYDPVRWKRIAWTQGTWQAFARGGKPWTLFATEDDDLVGYDPEGRIVSRMPMPAAIYTVVVHPSGDGYAAVVGRGEGADGEPAECWFAPYDPRTGTVGEGVFLERRSEMTQMGTVTATGVGCTFVTSRKCQGAAPRLLALGLQGGSLVVLYRCDLPVLFNLSVDPAGERAVLIVPRGAGVQVIDLTRAPPCIESLQYVALPELESLPLFGSVLECSAPRELVDAVRTEWKALDTAQQRPWIDALCSNPTGAARESYEGLLRAAAVAFPTDRCEFAESVFAAQDHGELAIAEAHAHVLYRLDRHREAIAVLERAAATTTLTEHGFHIRALCHYYLKEFDQALTVLRDGLPHAASCHLLEMLAVIEHRGSVQVSRPPCPLDPVIEAVRVADPFLGVGDWDRAIAALETPMVHYVADAQSVARLAYAYLCRGSRTPAEEFAAHMVFQLVVRVEEGRCRVCDDSSWWPNQTIDAVKSACDERLKDWSERADERAETMRDAARAEVFRALQTGDRGRAKQWLETVESLFPSVGDDARLLPVRAFASGSSQYEAQCKLADLHCSRGEIVDEAFERFRCLQSAIGAQRTDAENAWRASRSALAKRMDIRVWREVIDAMPSVTQFGLESRQFSTLDGSSRLFAIAREVASNVCLQMIATDDGLAHATVLFQLPFECETMFVLAASDRVWFINERAQMIALCRESWEPVAIVDTPPGWSADELVTHPSLAPDGVHVWIKSQMYGQLFRLRVVEPETGKVRAPWPWAIGAYPLVGGGRAEMMVFRDGGPRRTIRCRCDGTPLESPVPHAANGLALAAWCDGIDGFVEVATTTAKDEEDSQVLRAGFEVRAISTDGVSRSLGVFAPSKAGDPRAWGIDGGERRLFVLHVGGTGEAPELVACELAPSNATLLWRMRVPAETRLVTCPTDSAVFAVSETGDRFHSVRLCADPPRGLLFGDEVEFLNDLTDVQTPLECRTVTPAVRDILVARFGLPIATRIDIPRLLRAVTKGKEAAMMGDEAVKLMLVENDDCNLIEVAERFLATRPDLPFARRAAADLYAANDRWDDVARLLEGIDPVMLGRHGCHLKGLAAFHRGDVDAAKSAWRTGLPLSDGPCALQQCLSLAEAPPPEGDRAGRGFLHILAMVVRSDERRAAGDMAGALAALRRPEAFWSGDVQVMVRLVASLLDDGVHGAADDCLLRVSCHYLEEAFGSADRPSPGVLAPRAAWWDVERIRATIDRARAWFEAGDAVAPKDEGRGKEVVEV